MTGYTAPVRDMMFALQELAGLEALRALPGLGDASPELVGSVLEEAARLAAGVLAPLNRTGDTTGSRLRDGKVVTPPGFPDAYRAFREGGWPGLPFDPALGGQGLPEVVATAASEIWQSANMAFALCPMLTEGTVVTLEEYGTPELRQRFLPKLVSGEWTGTMNLTEPQAGSDLALVKTRAEPRDDHYLITGQKIFITWGDHDLTDNIVHMVLARLPDAPPGIKGISLFLVPKYLVNEDGTRTPNDVRPVSLEHKLGIHASPTCVLSYGDNGGAVGYLVGKPNDGIRLMFTMMNHARVAVGVQGTSISERAFQKARAYAMERLQGTVPGSEDRVAIIRHPDVRRMLMMMKAGTEAMRALCLVASASMDYMKRAADEAERERHAARFALLTPVVKAWCTELAQELTSLGVQVHGGMGYIEETGAAQYLRDARIITIYEGTTGIQANDLVGRKLLRDQGRAFTDLLAEMRAAVEAARSEGDGTLTAIAERQQQVQAALEEAGRWLLTHASRDAAAAGSGAVNFLMLAGTVCGGWLMLRAATSAARQLRSGSSDKTFLTTKLTTTRFYAEHYLPRAAAYRDTILAGPDAVMALADDQF